MIREKTSKPFGFMQSCPRWRPLVWFTRPSVVVTSQINSPDPGKYLPELPNFMQYYTWCHMHVVHTLSTHVICTHHLHVVCASSVCHLHVICMLSACHLCMRICCPHQDTSSAHCLQAICTTPHGHRGPELSFTVTGICYWMEFVAGMLNCFISGLRKWFVR